MQGPNYLKRQLFLNLHHELLEKLARRVHIRSKTHPGTFTQGSTAEWDISVTNTASGGATSGTVTVSDTLPSGYTVANFGTTSSSWT